MSRPFQADKVPIHGAPIHWSEIKIDIFTPTDLEIGCGVGWHPIQYSKENPKRHLIAIEHTANKFKSFEQRVRQHHLPNLTPVHANAISWITQEVPTESLDRIFLLYPNPNPKNPAQRWFRMPFFDFLISRLKSKGEILFATNEGFYAKEAKDYALNRWGLGLNKEEQLTQRSHPNYRPRTHFEKKYFLRGETCFLFQFLKN